MGKFTITCYCTACNDPKGSRATASGKTATAGTTCAVSSSLYKTNKNRTITIPEIGERVIQDYHGNSDDVIDVYVGECKTCRCSSHKWSGIKCEIPEL